MNGTAEGGRSQEIGARFVKYDVSQVADGQAVYSASKSGLVGLTLPIFRDLARSGIRSTAM